MVKVKICGITRIEDANAALECGADFLGFILYPPSPRAITPADMEHLLRRLRNTHQTTFASASAPQLVGVFVNQDPSQVAQILDASGLDLAQLSGDEGEQQVTDPASPLYGRAYKAIRPSSREEGMRMVSRYAKFSVETERSRPRILIDTPHGKLFGGTGVTGDWELAAQIAEKSQGVMLAGGLNTLNVADAVRTVRPYAVDVAGGVEASPGIKDHTLLKQFIVNAKGL